MPHRYVRYVAWIENIADADPCLARIVQEAAVARDAAIAAGVARYCPKEFEAAEKTLNSVKFTKVRPGTDAAWKRASDSLRKFSGLLERCGGRK